MFKKHFLPITIIAAIFVLAATIIYILNPESKGELLHGISFFDTEHEIEIKPYYDEAQDVYYLFFALLFERE